MVVSNSTWVRPAQALVYMESGKVRYFPPRNNGPIPRALTFHDDWENSRDSEDMDQSYDNDRFNGHRPYRDDEESCHLSFMITEGSTKNFNVEDPPDEYQSFEHEYIQQPVFKETDAFLQYEVPSMSTPTEQYTNLMRHKKQSHQTLTSGATGDCFSPLLHTDSNSFLPLDTLINLYTQRMHAARTTKSSPDSKDSPTLDHCQCSSEGSPKTENSTHVREDQDSEIKERMSDDCRASSTFPSPSPYSNQSTDTDQNSPMDERATLVLRRIDLEILLQQIEKMIDNPDSTEADGDSNKWLCRSIDEIQSLIDACCRETVKFEMMD